MCNDKLLLLYVTFYMTFIGLDLINWKATLWKLIQIMTVSLNGPTAHRRNECKIWLVRRISPWLYIVSAFTAWTGRTLKASKETVTSLLTQTFLKWANAVSCITCIDQRQPVTAEVMRWCMLLCDLFITEVYLTQKSTMSESLGM